MRLSAIRRPCVALLLPGSNNTPNKNAKLIIPGQQQRPGRQISISQPMTEDIEGGDGRRTFRPPMGYFTKQKGSPVVGDIDDELMLNRLRASSGLWHSLAPYLSKLYSNGYDSSILEELTGIPKGEQDIFITAASVLQSIADFCEETSASDIDDMMEFFDLEGTHFSLYELRFLTVEERVLTARYIAANRMDASEARDLARATKEYGRRDGETLGFEYTPEDILAFKFYRNAIESREESLIASFVEKGIKIARSEGARAKLEALIDEKESEEVQQTEKARIHIYRLLSSEVMHRPLPYAGDLTEVESSVLQDCPKATTSGEFNIFDLSVPENQKSHDWKWMALPNWPLFAYAKTPVALSIKNCAKIEALKSSISAKTDLDVMKLSGSGMIIVDVSVKEATDAASYYLVDDSGKLKISATANNPILGRILFVCRPPDKSLEF